MKIAVVGKGGSGKTTTSAVLARSLGRRGARVVALDCDTNPNLGLSLGVGDTETDRLVTLREEVDEGGAEHAADLGRHPPPLRGRRSRRRAPVGDHPHREP